jgi:hypothetical protein
MSMAITRHYRLLNIQVSTFILACAITIILLLHELSNILEIVLPELVPVHRNIDI